MLDLLGKRKGHRAISRRVDGGIAGVDILPIDDGVGRHRRARRQAALGPLYVQRGPHRIAGPKSISQKDNLSFEPGSAIRPHLKRPPRRRVAAVGKI